MESEELCGAACLAARSLHVPLGLCKMRANVLNGLEFPPLSVYKLSRGQRSDVREVRLSLALQAGL